jgi:DUF1680 family protein
VLHGLPLNPAIEKGYARIEREWQPGDQLTLELPMQIERLHAHPAVAADQGQVALRRGPLVYCVEQADHEAPIDRLFLPDTAELTHSYDAELLGGVVTLGGTAAALDDAGWEDTLYRSAPPATRPAELRAIPYYAWDNRTPGAMRVWLRRS